MMSMNSTIDPGQPCVMINGRAVGSGLGACIKWMPRPPIVVTPWVKEFSFDSKRPQSYSPAQ